MGNHKFRLSDMKPNSWFYKLRDMGRATRAQNTTLRPSKRNLRNPKAAIPSTKESNSSSKQFPQQKQVYIPNRPSYYFPRSLSPRNPKALDTHFPIDSPRKSKEKTRKLPINSLSSHPIPSASKSHRHARNSSSSASTGMHFDMQSLPPILTNPANKESRKDARLHRIKARPSSPKIDAKRVHAKRSKGMVNCERFSESLAVVKRSSDPQRDFRESMVEMIIENDIWDSKELEELLACYLSLNSVEYYDLIVKVFDEIWIDLKEVREIVVR